MSCFYSFDIDVYVFPWQLIESLPWEHCLMYVISLFKSSLLDCGLILHKCSKIPSKILTNKTQFVEERALSNTYIRLVALSYGLHLLMMTEISVFCFVLYFCMVYYGVLYFGAYPRSRSVD